MALSEVTEFRQQQAMQQQAALLGLQGLASGISRHDFINARMERGADYILGLFQAGKHEEAQKLLQAKTWADIEVELTGEGEQEICHATIPSNIGKETGIYDEYNEKADIAKSPTTNNNHDATTCTEGRH